jgi:hypothetical protein
MRIKILSAAESDLEEGHRFYETQADGLGNYFLDTRKEASKNSDFAQMQGAKKIPPRRIWFICKQEIFYATQQLG